LTALQIFRFESKKRSAEHGANAYLAIMTMGKAMPRTPVLETIEASGQAKPGAAEDRYWNAVKTRDRSFDGTFYYSVATTGVYCRPGCGARLPKRENVAFHASCHDAEAAGFRPCKRCKPNEAPLYLRYAKQVAEACRSIEAAEEVPRLAELARSAGLSPYHFHRIFKAVTGVTPKAYAIAHRHKRLRENLKRSQTVTEAIHESGFNSSGRFYANSNGTLGMTPSDYRAGGTGAVIRFAFGECSLGSILVAASEKGVTAILLGDDPQALIRELEDRFANATLIGGDKDFEGIVAMVVSFVEAPQAGLDLPLDIRGTAFQHRVWQALQDIPAGTTASYTEIARRIGRPKAVRAVASAIAANNIAVAIPCHRVIRSDGSLCGYHWGVERKRALIAREAKK
jgi:AraC family transcriptional regulator, regulatory protein of adaptative response / methylated-DNA-[protein]-cysteine methyltransferase